VSRNGEEMSGKRSWEEMGKVETGENFFVKRRHKPTENSKARCKNKGAGATSAIGTGRGRRRKGRREGATRTLFLSFSRSLPLASEILYCRHRVFRSFHLPRSSSWTPKGPPSCIRASGGVDAARETAAEEEENARPPPAALPPRDCCGCSGDGDGGGAAGAPPPCGDRCCCPPRRQRLPPGCLVCCC